MNLSAPVQQLKLRIESYDVTFCSEIIGSKSVTEQYLDQSSAIDIDPDVCLTDRNPSQYVPDELVLARHVSVRPALCEVERTFDGEIFLWSFESGYAFIRRFQQRENLRGD